MTPINKEVWGKWVSRSVEWKYGRLVVLSSSKPHQSWPLSLCLTLSSFLPFLCLSLYVGKFERKYERLVLWSSSKPHQSVICGGSTWEGHRDILLRNLIIPNRLIDQSINIVFNSFCSYSFLVGSKIKCLLGASKRNIYLEDGMTRQSLKIVFFYRFKYVLN